MITTILLLIFLTGVYPLRLALWANRKTTLFHAIIWALIAWIAWIVVFFLEVLHKEETPIPARYLALGLIGCASMAILGARRPGVVAWNFVIGGLLVVMMFLWFEGRLAEDDRILHRLRAVLLASTVAIGAFNYLPTRLAPAALMLVIGCGAEVLLLMGMESTRLEPARMIARFALASVPWIGYVRMRWRPKAPSEFDQVWLNFRDSFGLVWAQRLREQFNNSAAHANWPVVLHWSGLRLVPGTHHPTHEEQQAMLENLHALMKRFEAPDGKSAARSSKS
jgi:hypothetical protein